MVLKCFNFRDGDVRVVRGEVGPMLFCWLIDRSGNNLEILRVQVGHQKEAVTMMIHVIDQLFFPGLEHDGRLLRAISMNESDLGSQFALNLKKNELAAARLLD